ncbi:MAG TPA: hypothetical protein VGO28_09175 [Acidimicrobiia bacterium]
MSEHVHQHVPEELTEPGHAETRRERVLEVLAIFLLSAAAIGTAWSGYQAARWSGREAHNFALADASHAKSTRAATRSSEGRVQDLADFERWLDLETAGDQTRADIHAAHFDDELRIAFAAWLAQDPLNNPNAIPTPLRMPQYHQVEADRSAQLEAEAQHLLEDGVTARDRADEYVLTTVFFASVLFFAGISMRIARQWLRIGVLTLGVAFFVYGIVHIILLPPLI